MLSRYFKSERKLDQVISSPAGPYLDSFGQWLEHLKYKYETIRRHLSAAARFTDWIESKGITIDELSDESFDFYCKHLRKKQCLRAPNGDHTYDYIAARHFITFLKKAPAVRGPIATKTLPCLLLEYADWMQRQRGIKDSTLDLHCRLLANLLKALGERPEEYTAKDLREFILDHAGHYSKSYVKSVASAVRMFLRYLIAIGRCEPGLDNAIPSIAKRDLSSLPRYISAEDIECIIAACDPSTHIGARDLAVILLLARLGLRAGDVANLKITDINWNEKTLLVSGKNRRETRLPLPEDTGKAVRHYLERVRPDVYSDTVFITASAPFVPVSRQAISKTAERAICRAGVETPSRGAHIFRHSFATSLLRQGASLYTIGTLLRHGTVRTTTHYAKVDIELLKEVVMPWPEVTPC
jgi:integrase/recombinase XerD